MNFILTHDDDVAARLRAAHFSYLGIDSNGLHTFINDGSPVFAFEKSDKSKLTYTNVLAL